MRVAIVTPYFREPLEWLEECHRSVLAQTFPARHILVSDGYPIPAVDDWEVDHLKLPVNLADYGGTPRAVGAMMAATQGYDAVGLLDADNFLYPNHVEKMINLLKATGATISLACANYYTADLSQKVMNLRDLWSSAQPFQDNNTLFIRRPAMKHFCANSLMPDQIRIVQDRFFWMVLKTNGHNMAFATEPTVGYRCQYAGFYVENGFPIPAISRDPSKQIADARRWWEGLSIEDRGEILTTMGVGNQERASFFVEKDNHLLHMTSLDAVRSFMISLGVEAAKPENN